MAAPAPNSRSMSDIKSKLLNPALTSHFECSFNPPNSVREWAKQRQLAGAGALYDSDFLILSCCDASLPGSSLATHEITNDYTGVTERHAYRRLYDDRADFSFYVDHDYTVIQFFENWIAYIVNEQFKDGKGIETPTYSYRMNYPDGDKEGGGYRSPALTINKFEKDYSGRYLQYRFIQAYPISINSMPISYESSNLLKCTISFTYTRYILTTEQGMISKNPTEYSSIGRAGQVNVPEGSRIVGSTDINNSERLYDYLTPDGQIIQVIDTIIQNR